MHYPRKLTDKTLIALSQNMKIDIPEKQLFEKILVVVGEEVDDEIHLVIHYYHPKS